MYTMLALLAACLPNTFERDKFENTWWELQEYPACFNMHETGELLTFEGHIQSLGPWDYEDDGKYYIKDEDVTLTVMPYGDCWTISGYTYYNVTACTCTLRN